MIESLFTLLLQRGCKMGRLVETGQVIVTDSKNSIAVQTLIPPDYIEWIREVNNKVIFKIKDNIDVEELVKDINNLQYNLVRGNYAKYT
jgi:hypothetical protein